MQANISKKGLEIILSRLRRFDKPKVRNEQYTTPGDIAAEVLWKAYLNGDIEGKVIVDLGCGTGTFGIGALILGAKKAYFVDKDNEAISVCRQNIDETESEHGNEWEWDVFENDISEFSKEADMVITNPPFGTKVRHADRDFLAAAFTIADTVYSFHKTNTVDYIIGFADKNKMMLKERFDFNFMLRNTMKHHRKNKEYVKVSCLVFRKG